MKLICVRTNDYSITPMTSDSFMIKRSSPSILTSVPDHLPNNTTCFVAATGADGDDFALHGLFLGGVRDDDATLGLGVFLDPLHDYAVVQWTEFHVV
jgi:hypothetical protein